MAVSPLLHLMIRHRVPPVLAWLVVAILTTAVVVCAFVLGGIGVARLIGTLHGDAGACRRTSPAPWQAEPGGHPRERAHPGQRPARPPAHHQARLGAAADGAARVRRRGPHAAARLLHAGRGHHAAAQVRADAARREPHAAAPGTVHPRHARLHPDGDHSGPHQRRRGRHLPVAAGRRLPGAVGRVRLRGHVHPHAGLLHRGAAARLSWRCSRAAGSRRCWCSSPTS